MQAQLALRLPDSVEMVVLTRTFPGHNGSLKHGDFHAPLLAIMRNDRYQDGDILVGDHVVRQFAEKKRKAPFHQRFEVRGNRVVKDGALSIQGKSVTQIGDRQHDQAMLAIWKNGVHQSLDRHMTNQIRRVLSGSRWMLIRT